jgi:hypothetical protein
MRPGSTPAFPRSRSIKTFVCHANKANARAAAMCRTDCRQSKDICPGRLGRPSKKFETQTMFGKRQSAAYCTGEKGKKAKTAPCRIPIIKVVPSAGDISCTRQQPQITIRKNNTPSLRDGRSAAYGCRVSINMAHRSDMLRQGSLTEPAASLGANIWKLLQADERLYLPGEAHSI